LPPPADSTRVPDRAAEGVQRVLIKVTKARGFGEFRCAVVVLSFLSFVYHNGTTTRRKYLRE
jgi:hypothetical protein